MPGDGGGGGSVRFEELTGPTDPAAERAVLAAVLLDASGAEGALWRARAILRAEDFAEHRHGLLWEVLCEVGDRGEALDIYTVSAALRRRERLNSVGGVQYLGELTDEIPTIAHVEAHANIVADAASVRRTMEAARAVVIRGARGASRGELLGAAREVMEAAASEEDAGLLPIDVGLEEEEARLISTGTPEGLVSTGLVSTGLASVDEALAGGLWAGQLVVIGARPAVGKSALALLVACEVAASTGEPVVYASLEMPRRDLAMRAAALRVAAKGEPVDLMAIRTRRLSEEAALRYQRALHDLRGLPLLLSDRASVTVTQIRAMALRAKARAGHVAAVFVDYLQLLTPETARDSREREVAEASRALKALAGELRCPVVALSQLNRKATERKPTLADLRESGAIEQDADVVLLLHQKDGGRVLLVEKQRNGVAPQEVRLGWIAAAARFIDAPTGGAPLPVRGQDRDLPEDRGDEGEEQ